jgi:hypothetical protein
MKQPDVGKTTVKVSPVGCTWVGFVVSESKAMAEPGSEVTEWFVPGPSQCHVTESPSGIVVVPVPESASVKEKFFTLTEWSLTARAVPASTISQQATATATDRARGAITGSDAPSRAVLPAT